MPTDEEIITAVNAILEPFGGRVTGIGPDAVAVMGDARSYGPAITISLPPGLSQEEIAHISTQITNRAHGVTRVLLEIAH